MRARNYECDNKSELNFPFTKISLDQEIFTPRSKFKFSFEKKIEHLWLQSRTLGWSYNDFVAHLLEVLVVLRHRDAAKLAPAVKQKIVAS